MRIGIDGTCWAHQRGYGRFLRELLRALGAIDSSHRYIVYLDAASHAAFDLAGPFEARLIGTSADVTKAAVADGRRSVKDLFAMSQAIKEPLDVFFFPSVFSYCPLLRRVPVVLGIHDTIADRNPQLAFASRINALLWRAKVRAALFQADTIVTVSEYSKHCIAEWFRVSPSRIAVIQESSSAAFFPREYAPPARPFALYAGGISPNKNLPRLVAAFSRTQARELGAQLVLVGDYKSDGFKGSYAEVQAAIAKLHLQEDVVMTGFVSDEDLNRYYNTCTLFVMPSLDEGFGLPAIEAMTCGKPVIVSTGNSLEEVVGDSGVLVDALSEGELTAAIDRVFRDPELQQSLGQRALRRAKEYSWDRAAGQLLEILTKAAGQRSR